jgi:hypothetical protein
MKLPALRYLGFLPAAQLHRLYGLDYTRAFLPQSGQKKNDGLIFDWQCGQVRNVGATSSVG